MSSHGAKKRKADRTPKESNGEELDTSKPTSVFKPSSGRSWTVTIALPGSIIANCPTHDSKTALAGQIARAAAVFCVDEIVIFEDGQDAQVRERHRNWVDDRKVARPPAGDDGHTGWSDPSDFLFHLLSYLETPPHLRKWLFPLHPNLRTAGTLPSVDMPHHLRANEWCRYREGITGDPVDDPRPPRKKPRHTADDGGDNLRPTTVYTGLPTDSVLPLPTDLPPYTRLTLKFPSAAAPASLHDPGTAAPVDPSAPREEAGYYWGYQVRRAATVSHVFTECPFADGYDLSIGTSERGRPVDAILPPRSTPSTAPTPSEDEDDDGSEHAAHLPSAFNHLLVAFGGVAGLEAAVGADPALAAKGVGKGQASALFDFWVDLCPGQGSRTIRSEEAVWVGLSSLWPWIRARREVL